MRNANGWLQGIQYFRASAVIEVIALHVLGFVAVASIFGLQKDLIAVLIAFTSFAVPHFLFISGVVLYNKYSDGFSVSTFYKKRFSSVLPPYLVWTTFYYFYPLAIGVLYSAVFGPSNYGSDVSLRGYVAGLALGIKQLWFILLIMQLYLLYPLLVKAYNRFAGQKNPIYFLSLLFLVQVVYSSLFITTPTQVPTAFWDFFLSGIFYFVFGFFIAEHYGTLTDKLTRVSLKSISLVVALSTLCYAVIFYRVSWLSPTASSAPAPYIWLYQIVGPFYCLLLIIFYLRISFGWGEPHGFFTRYLEKIGENSFGIYLIHMFFITIFALALTTLGIGYDNLFFYPTLIFLALLSSYWSVQLIYRLPFSSIVIGKPRKKAQTPA